ncbi:DUF2637 domain-containing protein [Rhodococcus hoagii]|nr:DUF2637 domain-containing protein [Prescottella equi]
MTLVLAALAFTLSFDALRALAIDIGVRPQRAWMAPVAIDIAQAAATAGLVVIGVADKYKTARWYCMGLATLTVLLSVAGNSYHAYGLAQQNLARVAAGEDLGFNPQPPVVAACIAAIFPLLWLALLHLFTIMLRVIVDERTAADGQPAAQAAGPTQRAATPEPSNGETKRNEAIPARGSDPVVTVHRDEPDLRQDIATTATATAAPATANAPATHHTDTAEPTPAPVDASPTSTVVIASTPVQPVGSLPVATRTGYPQTRTGLLEFLADSGLSDQVKEVAHILIAEPNRTQTDLARQLHVDKSTISRRWKPFVEAAKAEGFTVPPLPRPALGEASAQHVRELQPA